MRAASVAQIDLDAVAANTGALAELSGPAALCAVVKADGYGHGAVAVARAALGAGATWLAVAQVEEAADLRAAGLDAPILVLSEPPPDPYVVDRALALGLHLTVYRPEFVAFLAQRARHHRAATVPVHLKVDTGMRRVGCEPSDAMGLARCIADEPGLRLTGTMTHLALADEPDHPTTARQLASFDEVIERLRSAGVDPGVRHAANSAAAVVYPESRYDLVRVGIALYGIRPGPRVDIDLVPALRWTSRVALVKSLAAGEAVSYGHRHVLDRETRVATVPVGYADGLRRDFGLSGGQVLVGGRRCPVLGVVTMDQCVVDIGDVADVVEGDEVVLLGRQGDEEIRAEEVAERLGTIGYEVVCAISPRVQRWVGP